MPKKRKNSLLPSTPRLRVLMGSMTSMGPGRADLMDAINRTGSISAAAREMQMSYRRAWELIESTNAAFIEPLIITSADGSGGGGAQLTDFGRGVIERYRAMETKAVDAMSGDFAIFSKLMNPHSPVSEEVQQEVARKPSRKSSSSKTS
jgi:molybdate transport system regulatory protein